LLQITRFARQTRSFFLKLLAFCLFQSPAAALFGSGACQSRVQVRAERRKLDLRGGIACLAIIQKRLELTKLLAQRCNLLIENSGLFFTFRRLCAGIFKGLIGNRQELRAFFRLRQACLGRLLCGQLRRQGRRQLAFDVFQLCQPIRTRF